MLLMHIRLRRLLARFRHAHTYLRLGSGNEMFKSWEGTVVAVVVGGYVDSTLTTTVVRNRGVSYTTVRCCITMSQFHAPFPYHLLQVGHLQVPGALEEGRFGGDL